MSTQCENTYNACGGQSPALDAENILSASCLYQAADDGRIMPDWCGKAWMETEPGGPGMQG